MAKYFSKCLHTQKIITIGRLFSRLQILRMEQERECGNYFHEMTLAELFTIHVNLHAMEFLLISSEPNFMEVPKIHKIYSP